MFIALLLSLVIGQTSPGAPLAANAVIKPTPVPGISYRLQPHPLPLEIKEVRELVRLSDFIGFVQASNVWSFNEIVKIESLKGVFPIGSPPPKLSKSYEEQFSNDPRLFWMRLPDDKHEMLVFGKYVAERQGKVFTMLTGFRVASDLNPAGRKIQVILDTAGKSVVERNVLITLLTHLIKGEKPDATVLETFERSLKIADNGCDAHYQGGVTYALRAQQAKELIQQIRPGMTRKEAERILPPQDGGGSSFSPVRYYFGAGVMIEVSYENSFLSPYRYTEPGRVVGTPIIYSSWYHQD